MTFARRLSSVVDRQMQPGHFEDVPAIYVTALGLFAVIGCCSSLIGLNPALTHVWLAALPTSVGLVSRVRARASLFGPIDERWWGVSVTLLAPMPTCAEGELSNRRPTPLMAHRSTSLRRGHAHADGAFRGITALSGLWNGPKAVVEWLHRRASAVQHRSVLKITALYLLAPLYLLALLLNYLLGNIGWSTGNDYSTVTYIDNVVVQLLLPWIQTSKTL
jgi:hypothetical protein